MMGNLFLVFYGSLGGGAVGDILFRWEQAGVFSYVIPFLLIFALIYGLLNKMNFFGKKGDDSGSKGINLVIALAVSLLSLQFEIVSIFFAEIFPKVGVGLAIILTLFILLGLFWPSNNAFNWVMVFFGLGLVAWVIFSSLGVLGSIFGPGISSWGFYNLNWSSIIGIIIFVGAFILIIAPGWFKSKPVSSTGNSIQNAITEAIKNS